MCLHRAGSKRSTFSKEVSEKNTSFLSVLLWGWEIKYRKLRGASQTVTRFYMQMKGVLPMASGVIIID